MIKLGFYVSQRLKRSNLPTVMEKAKIAKDLDVSLDTLYRWCREDNIYVDHATVGSLHVLLVYRLISWNTIEPNEGRKLLKDVTY